MRNKVALTALIVILVSGLIFTGMELQNSKETAENLENNINSLEEELDAASTSLSGTKEELKGLEVENQQMQLEIETYSEMVDKYNNVNDFIDLELLENEQIEKVEEISKGTPLDYEAAYYVVKYSDVYDIPYSLMISVIDIESEFDQFALGSDQDRGYMQIIPDTEKWLAREYGDELGIEYNPENIYNPEYNIALGIKYFATLMDSYGDNYDRVLSSYNRGPYNLAAYYESNKTYATSYSQAIIGNQYQYYVYND